MEEKVNAVLEQILKQLHDQSVLADRRHEEQAAFNAHVSQQLHTIREQRQLLQAAPPTAACAPAGESMLAKVARECGGDISSSQEEILANSSFLGGDNALPDDDEEEEEDFCTPPDAIQQQDDPVPDDAAAPPAKKRSVCISGARLSTPTPSPTQQQQQQPQPVLTGHVDPLVGPVQDFLTLCRRKGLI